ncbi:helix-turn-helix transcriptional regulator [Actinomadura barringtoniae]|uniref:Helix-turn-helix transcriptional regulator n=1 Tax=Actinomadura barringtoniae TaxID=1427535 RepID=A0A939PGF7_9ACTN|nr:helix-turn-helix transcriptional regulator [Actinomadura barringtoniae]MBO2452201.1 helix-turn-helix transcriptional regulator [Actinomadura barringtoniae]
MKDQPNYPARALYAQWLRKHREAADLHQSQVAEKLQISPQLYGHWENLRRLPTLDGSKRLDRLYGLPAVFEGLQPLVVQEAGTLAVFLTYVSQEEQSDAVRAYEPLYVFGPLQTEAYAREILSAAASSEKLDEQLETRTARKAILDKTDPPYLLVLLAERVIREIVGNAEIMREQLAHLLELAEQRNIDLQIIPAGARAYPSGEIVLLGYPEDPDLAYVESAGGHGKLIEPPAEVHALWIQFDRIRTWALSPEDSVQMIRTVMEAL